MPGNCNFRDGIGDLDAEQPRGVVILAVSGMMATD
jgi:hypothetical protein